MKAAETQDAGEKKQGGSQIHILTQTFSHQPLNYIYYSMLTKHDSSAVLKVLYSITQLLPNQRLPSGGGIALPSPLPDPLADPLPEPLSAVSEEMCEKMKQFV